MIYNIDIEKLMFNFLNYVWEPKMGGVLEPTEISGLIEFRVCGCVPRSTLKLCPERM